MLCKTRLNTTVLYTTQQSICKCSIKQYKKYHTLHRCNSHVHKQYIKQHKLVQCLHTTYHQQQCYYSSSTYKPPLDEYHEMIKSGRLREDERQIGAMTKLNNLWQCIKNNPDVLQPSQSTDTMEYSETNTDSDGGNFFSGLASFFGSSKRNNNNITSSSLHVKPVSHDEISSADSVSCKSLYLWGGVGCGKTMLMDLFYNNINSQYKLRQHYHNFMLDIHSRLHTLRQTHGDMIDPVTTVANELSATYKLICLDEFQVTDVADAMILRRLWSRMFNNGVILVATSNRKPQDLYYNGINRTEFLPFIDVLNAFCIVHEMTQGTDHRLIGTLSHGIYHYPNNRQTRQSLDNIFKHLQHNDNDKPQSIDLKVMMNRSIKVPKCTQFVAYYTFSELCEQNYGAADYIAIADKFPYVIISDIPQLDSSERNKIRRFITMLDIFYEQHVRVIFGASTSIDELFTGEQSVGDEQFASGRAISRLNEMRTKEYFNHASYARDGSTATNIEFDKVFETNTDS